MSRSRRRKRPSRPLSQVSRQELIECRQRAQAEIRAAKAAGDMDALGIADRWLQALWAEIKIRDTAVVAPSPAESEANTAMAAALEKAGVA